VSNIHFLSLPPNGGGPEDPMLEKRVEAVEVDVSKIKGILERLEPKIGEILLTGAKQADLHKTQLDIAEMKGRLVATDARLSSVPTTTQLVLWLLTTWGAGAATVFAVIKFAGK
jgi:hypothetical protein